MADDAPLPDEALRADPAPPAEKSPKPPTPDGIEVPTPDQAPTRVEVPTPDQVPTPGQVPSDEVPSDEVPTPGQVPSDEVPSDEVPAQAEVEVPSQAEVPLGDGGRSAAARVSRRGAHVGSVRPSRVPSVVRQKLVLAIAFGAPSLVIAASVYFIVRGGDGHAQLPFSAVSAQPVPSSSPAQFPGEVEEDGSELSEPLSDAGPSLEQPNQLVPELTAPGAALPGFEDETGDEEPAPSKPAPPKHFASVQEAAMGSCSTESVDGLSRQIIDQARCLKPNEFVPLPKRANLVMAPNVYPYLELGARDHLLKALDSKKGQTMTINSALRTVAQQYLVSHWSLSKICGVQMATRPGESNHEIGTALDIKEAASWRPALEAQEFKWLGASDRVHFDYKSTSPTRVATDVLAFQKLWNRNHKDDAISESGRFDAATEQRLKKAPPSGFALGASCAKARAR